MFFYLLQCFSTSLDVLEGLAGFCRACQRVLYFLLSSHLSVHKRFKRLYVEVQTIQTQTQMS